MSVPETGTGLSNAAHHAVCELASIAAVLDGLTGTDRPAPVLWLKSWVDAVARDLDAAWCAQGSGGTP